MSEKNFDLLEVSRTLNELANKLHQRKARTTDEALYSTLNNELIEVNHRITMVGGLIFRERTSAITAAAKKVEDSKAGVVEAIRKIEEINTFIRTISGFLGMVDKAIDIAKRI